MTILDDGTQPVTSSPAPKRRFLSVCQYRSCTRSGAEAVLQALKETVPPGVVVMGSGCLGQCGSGPMVQVTPDDVWYCRVQTADVPEIVSEHLQGDRPLRRLLHPRFHPSFDASSFAD